MDSINSIRCFTILKKSRWCEVTVARQREKSGGSLIHHSRPARIRDDGRDKEGREERRCIEASILEILDGEVIELKEFFEESSSLERNTEEYNKYVCTKFIERWNPSYVVFCETPK